MKRAYIAIAFFFIALVTFATWAPEAGAWSNFSKCSTCHPFSDQNPQTHTAHINLGLRCNGCHVNIPGNPHEPGINCNDCHSGIADTPKMTTCGACHLKRGVAIHHINSEQTCGSCHGSTPDSENNPVPGYAGLRLEPCTDNLDNDGDLAYDDQDPDCAPPTECGNGIQETGEGCDDGNTENCDGCSAICTVEDECNDGDVCNGEETCDPTGGCQPGKPLNCNDSNLCTTDSCDAISGCANDPVVCPSGQECESATGECVTKDLCAGNSCDDGNACNGVETCNPEDGSCIDGTALSCDDGNTCNGDETCDPTTGCQPGTPLVCDNGLFCDGAEACDPATGCEPGFKPCRSGTTCNESTDSCDTCVLDADCDNGLFCDGAESCVYGQCQKGTAPCDSATQKCNEVDDVCDDLPNGCTSAADCDDGNACTADRCDSLKGCTHEPVICNDDGSFCNGRESCDPASGCSSSGNPCADGETCNETNNSCDPPYECTTDGDCNNGVFCDGAESCVDGQCQKGTAPCTAGETCDEQNDSCTPLPPETTDISVDGISATRRFRECSNNAVKVKMLLGNSGDSPVVGTVTLYKNGDPVEVWKDIDITGGKGKGMTLDYEYQLMASDKEAAAIQWQAVVTSPDDSNPLNNESDATTQISECGKPSRDSEPLTTPPDVVTDDVTANSAGGDDESADDESADD